MKAVVFSDGARTIDLQSWPIVQVRINGGSEVFAGAIPKEQVATASIDDLLGPLLAGSVSFVRRGDSLSMAVGALEIVLRAGGSPASRTVAPELRSLGSYPTSNPPPKPVAEPLPPPKPDAFAGVDYDAGNIFAEERESTEKEHLPVPANPERRTVGCVGLPERAGKLEKPPQSKTNIFITSEENFNAAGGFFLDASKVYGIDNILECRDLDGCTAIHVYETNGFDLIQSALKPKVIDHRVHERKLHHTAEEETQLPPGYHFK